jgi:hypothetical protein
MKRTIGKKGFSKERYAFWRQRFEEISELEGFDSWSQESAKKAAEAMKQVEAGK